MRSFFGILSLLALLLHVSWAFAYKDERHKEINDLAVQNLALGLQGLDLNAHLERTIGLRLDSTVDGLEVNRHIILAGPKEDVPFWSRCWNHFHDPTRHTDVAALPWMPGVSAVKWALNSDDVQDGAWGGNYSWPAARRSRSRLSPAST